MAAAAGSTDIASLDAALTTALPDPLEVGAGTVLYLEGTCEAGADPESLALVIADRRFAVDAEPGESVGDAVRGEVLWRWWVLAQIPAGLVELKPSAELVLEARLGGCRAAAALGALRLVTVDLALAPPAPSVVVDDGPPLIAVCMATHEPDRDRLAEQLRSIRDQSWPNWVCVISDDASSPARLADLQALTAEDERFVVSRSDRRLGFYKNFERALRMVPTEASFVALADQDDVWYSGKLASLREALVREPDAQLAYSDMRIVDQHGAVISDTYWILRSNRSDDLISLLVANTVTGAASLVRRALLDVALPFPPPVGRPYHDHWLAICALAAGGLAYVDQPTYDRVRHLDSVTAGTGHAEALRRMRDGRAPARSSRPSDRGPRDLRAIYRDSYLQSVQFARIAALRLAGRIDRRRRQELQRFAAADSAALGLPWLALRSLRPLVGRDETLGRERALAAAILWRRRARRRQRRGRSEHAQSL
jgi:hypothetical protein